MVKFMLPFLFVLSCSGIFEDFPTAKATKPEDEESEDFDEDECQGPAMGCNKAEISC